MQTQTNNQPGAQSPYSRLFKIWKRMSRNAPMKLFAVLLAVFFWLVVLSSDPTLEREKVFETNATVTGAETLRSRGFIVTDDLIGTPIAVEMTAEVTQGNYDRATATSFSPRLDLSQITEEGEQEIFFTAGYSTYGVVKEFEPASITVNVERYATRSRVPVTVRATGESSETLWHSVPVCDPAIVSVSGPASLVNQVRRAVAELPLESLSQDLEMMSLTSALKLETADGEVIESPLIQVTAESIAVDSVRIDCSVLPLKTVPVDLESAVTGMPAHGYVISEVSISPPMVTLADSANALEYMNAIYLESAVNVQNATQNIMVTVPIQSASAYAYCSAKEATVNVTIVPATHTHTYSHLAVAVENLAPGLQAKLSRTEQSAVISGAYQDVEGLRAENVHLYVNAAGLEPGVYSVPVLCRVDGTESYSYQPQQPAITLTITEEPGFSAP